MKLKTKPVMIAFLLVVLLVASAVALYWVQKPLDLTTYSRKVFLVEGMTSERCTVTITDALESQSGVVKADVRLGEKKAIVYFDSDTVQSKALKPVIEDAGFQVLDKKANSLKVTNYNIQYTPTR